MLDYTIKNAKLIAKQITYFAIHSDTPHETVIKLLNLLPEMENDFKTEIIYYTLTEFNDNN